MIDISKVRIVHDFPTPGIKFYDITTVMNDAQEYQRIFKVLMETARAMNPEVLVALEARGYYFGPALALALGIPFVPIRKKGKLPYKTYEESYDLEYGSATIAIHQDAMKFNQRILLFDDILATGGTASAAIKLVKHFAPSNISALFFMEIIALKGREKMPGIEVCCLSGV
ncbi:MAG: adenine phosphoribosyltransferase [Bacteroidales bacterium]